MKETVQRYYDLVDAGQYEALLELFSPDILYIRAGKEIAGREQLRSFYLSDRKLVGNHRLSSVKACEDECVIVEGLFVGTNSHAENISIPFADIFEFSNGCIVRRRTYLGVMNQIIE